MARKENRTKKVNTGTATFNVVGTLTDVYEGKNNNYLTIKVNRDDVNPKTKEPYYDLIKVTASPDLELFDDGTEIAISGTIRSWFDSEAKRTLLILTADTVSEVSNT